VRKLVVIFIASLSILIVIGWFLNQSEASTVYAIAIYWVTSILFLTVFGNYTIYRLLNLKMPWDGDSLQRILWQLLFSGIYTMLCANLSYYLIKSQFTEFPPDGQQMILLNIYAVFIIIPVFSIFFGIYFLAKWKRVTIEMETAKKEAIRSELLALKNHIDPHFLFNNLNILSSLIDQDNASAQSFLEKFSEVYRYVLHHKDSEIIKLDQEIQFLEAYIFLINTRFSKQIECTISIDEKQRKMYIPPLTIQMLVENALKHNSFSAKQKLKIKVFTEGPTLIVENNYRPKVAANSSAKTEGSGLKNIKKRYEILCDSKPEIIQSETHFCIKIPLIKKPLK